jgi:hypothetical protein
MLYQAFQVSCNYDNFNAFVPTSYISCLCRLNMSLVGKDIDLPSCPKCRATMDLQRSKSFGSRHVHDKILYYCNNPMCPPDEEERRERLNVSCKSCSRMFNNLSEGVQYSSLAFGLLAFCSDKCCKYHLESIVK